MGELQRWKLPPIGQRAAQLALQYGVEPSPPSPAVAAALRSGPSPIRYDVVVRCAACARTLGRQAPSLVFLGLIEEGDHRYGHRRWALYQVDRRGILAGARGGETVISDEAADKLREVGLALQEGRPPAPADLAGRVGLVELGPLGRGGGLEVACRRCRRPWRAKARNLYRDAEEALAQGRDVLYR